MQVKIQKYKNFFLINYISFCITGHDIFAKTAPEILCHTENIAPGTVAIDSDISQQYLLLFILRQIIIFVKVSSFYFA